MSNQTSAPPTPVAPASLLAAARGFSALFWGLLLILLVLAGALTVRLPLLARVPGHTLGLLILLVGAFHLRHAFAGDRGGRRLLRILILTVLLQVYLVPFLGWWRAGTAAWYATLNLGLLVLGGLALLAVMTRLAQHLAERLQDEVMRVEARLCLWAVPVLGAVGLGLLMLRTGRLALQADPVFALKHVLLWPDPLALFPCVLPFVPALAMAWEIKERALRGLLPAPATPPE